MQQMGVDLATVNSANTDDHARPYTPPDSGAIQLQVFDEQCSLPSFLEALKQKNLARMLAEPNIVTVSGRPASFHMGGEIPVPATPGSKPAVEFLRFGTEVDVIAVTLGADHVRLELRIRVSKPDFGYTTIIEGRRVPSIEANECKTTATVAFWPVGRAGRIDSGADGGPRNRHRAHQRTS